MEEKLDMIFRKLIEIDNNIKKDKFETKLKVLENQQKELNYQMDDLKHNMIREQEYNDELLARFISIRKYPVEEVE